MPSGLRCLTLRLPASRGAAAQFVVYSAAIHLTLALLGRPLGLTLPADSQSTPTFHVRLVENATSTAVIASRNGGDGTHPPSALEQTGTAVFPPEPPAALPDTPRTGPIEEEGVQVVEAPGPEPPQPQTRRKSHKNMTGPEDCLLKVVAMICPAADLQCMADYQTFCASLPDSEAPSKR